MRAFNPNLAPMGDAPCDSRCQIHEWTQSEGGPDQETSRAFSRNSGHVVATRCEDADFGASVHWVGER